MFSGIRVSERTSNLIHLIFLKLNSQNSALAYFFTLKKYHFPRDTTVNTNVIRRIFRNLLVHGREVTIFQKSEYQLGHLRQHIEPSPRLTFRVPN